MKLVNIGLKIKELRNEKGLNQNELAEILKISRPSLALYETGKREIPNKLLWPLAIFFDVKTDYLFDLEN